MLRTIMFHHTSPLKRMRYIKFKQLLFLSLSKNINVPMMVRLERESETHINGAPGNRQLVQHAST